MAKKSAALLAAEQKIQELEQEIEARAKEVADTHERVYQQRSIDVKEIYEETERKYRSYIQSVEYLLDIVQRSKLPEFVTSEAGRLLAESSKLRP